MGSKGDIIIGLRHCFFGRAPRGARGLKRLCPIEHRARIRSRPARGAWIETPGFWSRRPPGLRRAPRGARGLKHFSAAAAAYKALVAPRAGRVD